MYSMFYIWKVQSNIMAQIYIDSNIKVIKNKFKILQVIQDLPWRLATLKSTPKTHNAFIFYPHQENVETDHKNFIRQSIQLTIEKHRNKQFVS